MFTKLRFVAVTCFQRPLVAFNSTRNRCMLFNKNYIFIKIRHPNSNTNVQIFQKSKPESVRFISENQRISKNSKKLIGSWLLGCSGMVFVAVVLGGVTRLTESGLSMVTWKLLGERRPITEVEWKAEFERYKQFPEFKVKNSDMTLNEFKWIYYMEYAHRMWGRTIGLFYAVPGIYFWTKGYFDRNMKYKVIIFGSLIGLQGLMGWYMVKSGLEDRFHDQNDVPRVSQYRLASHLTFAFLLYALFLWNSLSYLLPAEKMSIITKKALKFRKFALMTKGMIFLTALSGAFVAGLDAGLIYNSFPRMADRWIPSDLLAMNPTIRNFTENPTTVQFDHRILGMTTLSLITVLWILSKKTNLPTRAYKVSNALFIMGWTQVALGISTLLNYVPSYLAAAHQSGSLMLLSFAIWLTHELKYLKYIPK